MRVLILGCHTKGKRDLCTEALFEAFQGNNIPCIVEDALSYIPSRLSRWLSQVCLRRSEGHSERDEIHKAVRLLSAGAEHLYAFLIQTGFDTVLCTHVFAALMVTEVMRRHDRFLQTYFVSTDFCCPPCCGQSDLDRYFIPAQDLAGEFVRRGVSAERLAVTGIPVPKAYDGPADKREAKRRTGLSLYTPHLLILSAGMGREMVRALIRRIAKGIQPNSCVSVVCGGDQSLSHQLEREYAENHGIRVHSDTSDLPELMDGADLLLTRPEGGITTAAAQKRLPMVLVHSSSDHEWRNLRYFTAKGVALTADTPAALAKLACNLIFYDKSLENMAEKYPCFPDRPAAEQIAAYVMETPTGRKERQG